MTGKSKSRRRSLQAGLMLLWLASTLAPAADQPARPVRLTNGEWPPYLSASLPFNGVLSRIVSEAFALQGLEVQYGFFPWTRALTLARIGSWDGSAAWIRSPERERDFYYSDPVLSTEVVLVHLKIMPFSWNSVGDLGRYRIGVTQDYAYGDAFAAAIANGKISVDIVGHDEQNLTKLLGGRIDLFPIDRRVGEAMIGRSFSGQDAARLVFDTKPLHTQPLHIIFSKAGTHGKELVEQFNQGLRKLKASGRLDALIRQP
jgi:polar amino acid transport system substrate-binding protein